MEHLDRAALDAGLDHIRQAPPDGGELLRIVRRPAVDEREELVEARLDPVVGLDGDTWVARGSRHTTDGSANPDQQLTIMNARVAALVAQTPERWALAGDQLYLDLDLSTANLPPGTRLAIGSAVIEVTAHPHRGCAKFARRYGQDAQRWVNSEEGIARNFRGINARVISAGTIRLGDRAVRR